MAYLQLPIELDLQTLINRAVARIKVRQPGYVFDTASLDAALLEEMVRLSVEDRQTMVVMADEAFAEFGRHELDTPMITAEAASVEVTVTAINTTGHVIAAGQLIATLTGGDQPVAFALVDDLVIPADSASAPAVLHATVAGTQANNLGPGAMTLVQAPAVVASVSATSPSAGGVDAETGAQFRDRMAGETRLLLRVPTKAWQYEIAAQRIPGVHRALARERYDADTDTDNAGGHVTIAAVDSTGQPVAAPIKELLEAEFLDEYRRIINLTPHIIDAILQPVAVHFEAVATADADPVDVETAATAAINAYLNPGTYAGGDQTPPVWLYRPIIRRQTISSILLGIDGLDHWTTLTLDAGTDDVELVGVAVLPDPTVTGTVDPP